MLESPAVGDYRHLVQILLPLFDNGGVELDKSVFARSRAELTVLFGGLRAHVRAPASGLWKAEDGAVERDDIVILEVLVETLEPAWWRRYRAELERRFAQDVVIIRAIPIETI